jgi:hypothetical protein
VVFHEASDCNHCFVGKCVMFYGIHSWLSKGYITPTRVVWFSGKCNISITCVKEYISIITGIKFYSVFGVDCFLVTRKKLNHFVCAVNIMDC